MSESTVNPNAELDGIFGYTKNTSFALGDIPHAAVVASTCLHMLIPGAFGPAAISGYASWAGDLMGLWSNYEDAHAQVGGSLDAYTFLRSRIGAAIYVDNGLSDRDLRADALGHVIAHEVQNSFDRIDQIVMKIQLQLHADPGWLAKRWYELRFGNQYEVARACGRDAVSGIWAGTPIDALFNGVRKPGAESGPGQHQAPPASVRETEADAVGRAFADALVDVQTSWTLRS